MKEECEKLMYQIKEIYKSRLETESEYNDWGLMLKAVVRGDISIRIQRDPAGLYTVHIFSNSHIIVIPDHILYVLPKGIIYGYNDIDKGKIVVISSHQFYYGLGKYPLDFKTALEEIIISII
jgi:hypothetical protein